MKPSERRVAQAVEAAGPELANAIGEIVYWALMRPGNAKASPVQQSIERAVANAMEKAGAYGSELAQTRTTVRIAAAMRIVGCVYTDHPERISSIWNTAAAFVEPPRPELKPAETVEDVGTLVRKEASNA